METRWRMCTSVNYVIIGSDNDVSPVRRQTIIWTNAGLLLIRPGGRNSMEIAIKIEMSSLKNLHLNMSFVK